MIETTSYFETVGYQTFVEDSYEKFVDSDAGLALLQAPEEDDTALALFREGHRQGALHFTNLLGEAANILQSYINQTDYRPDQPNKKAAQAFLDKFYAIDYKDAKALSEALGARVNVASIPDLSKDWP